MSKLLTASLALLLIFSACKSADNQNKPAQQSQQTQTQPKADMSSLQKWPADYPVTGDSVAVLSIEQDGAPLGDIVIEFLPDKAPNHVRNFKWLADHGFYNSTKFHRVIKGFMIQGGDPKGDGSGGPGWKVDAEFNDVKHVKGIVSMARTNDPNSAGSQFFICHGDPSNLNGQYTVFGRTIKGLDVVDKIADTEVGGTQHSSPVKPVVIKSAKIVARSSIQ